MTAAKLHKVVAALPGSLEANSLYLVRVGTGFSLIATNDSGTVSAYELNGILPAGGEAGQLLRKASAADYDAEWAKPSFRQQFRAYTDCISNVATNEFAYIVSGTGAAFSTAAIGSDNVVGIMRAALGTTATGRAAIVPSNAGVLRFGLGVATFDISMRLVNLSDATNTYTCRTGFIDSATGESTYGVFLRYTHGTNGGRWQAVCRTNNVETAVDTGVAAAANAWLDAVITVNAAGTSAAFTVNGALVATITTNIPSATGRKTGYGVMALRSVGTTAFNAYDCDAIEVTYDFTTTR